jgi:hypothetical protein
VRGVRGSGPTVTANPAITAETYFEGNARPDQKSFPRNGLTGQPARRPVRRLQSDRRPQRGRDALPAPADPGLLATTSSRACPQDLERGGPDSQALCIPVIGADCFDSNHRLCSGTGHAA